MKIDEVTVLVECTDVLRGIRVVKGENYCVRNNVPSISVNFDGDFCVGNLIHELGHFVTCHPEMLRRKNFGMPAPTNTDMSYRFAMEELYASVAATVLANCVNWNPIVWELKLNNNLTSSGQFTGQTMFVREDLHHRFERFMDSIPAVFKPDFLLARIEDRKEFLLRRFDLRHQGPLAEPRTLSC